MGKEVRQSRQQLRLFSLMAMTMIALAFVILALLLVPGAMGGSIVGDQPPASGDWVITKDTVVTDETVTILGNVSVHANLTLMGSTLRICPTYNGSESINVTADGALMANHSVIKSGNGYSYSFLVHGEMDLTRVTVKNTYWGVQVRTGKDVLITDVLLTDLFGSALQLVDADNTIVRDLRVHDDGYQLWTGQIVVTDTVNGFVERQDYLPGLIVISGGSPSVDGVDISLNGTLYYYVSFHQNTANGGLTLDLEWPIIDVDSRDAIALSDIWVRESNLGLNCTVRHGQGVPRTTSADVTFGISGFVFHNYREASVAGFNFTSFDHRPIELNVTLIVPATITTSSHDWGNRAVHAYVDEEFNSAGPHRSQLEIRDIALLDDALLLHRMVPGYSGTSSPTFDLDLLVDNVTVWMADEPVRLVLEPSFALFKTFDVDIRFSNCTFREGLGPAVDFSYRTGPTIRDYRSITINEETVFSSCMFLGIVAGNHGVIKVSTNIHTPHAFNSSLTVSDGVFMDNSGTLLNINGTFCTARDRLVLHGNTFRDNVCVGSQRLMYVSGRTEVVIINNTFTDNEATNGFYLYYPGGYFDGVRDIVDPCEFNISNNRFLRNWAHEEHAPPRAFIDIIWGGDLIISDNEIGETGSEFLNLSESIPYSWICTLDFRGNEVYKNDHAVLWFSKNDRGHQYLEVYIQENVVWDNKGALVDFLLDLDYLQFNDYGATFHLLDNDVSGAGSTVFRNYGNITVSGNNFTDCVGWVLRLEHLNLHRPYLTNNTFTRCGDTMLIRAKRQAMAPVLLWMDNNHIDSTGTAIEFYYMEATLLSVTVTSTATRAVVADISYVDAYDCDFEMEDCEVVVDGYIRMWYWVEAWVHWASKAGVATSNPVAEANVTFIDQAGGPSLTVFSDDLGHLDPFEVLAWHIEHSTAPVEKNPYTIVVSLSSFRSSVELTIDRSYKGTSALDLLLWDPEDPLVSIDSPEHMIALSTLDLEISGFATDSCSGVHTLTVELNGEQREVIRPDSEGNYLHEFQNVPEGLLEVRVTVTDAGLNTMVATITVEVDRTAPRLVVTHPSDDLFTNSTTINIRGEVEAGADLMINMLEVATPTSLFDVTLPLNEGPNYFGLTATDRAGNTASVVIWVTRDTFLPELVLFGPSDGTATNASDIKVWGRVAEYHTVTLTLHRMFTDIIDRPIHPDENDQFEVLAELEEGENKIVVTVRDQAGNSVTARRTVTRDTTPPLLELVSPEDDTLLRERQVTVHFTVSDDAAQVYVNGKRVLGTGDLETVVMLGEGENPIRLRAVDLLYNVATLSIIVHVDTVAPTLEVTTPDIDPVRTNDPAIEVRGTASDGSGNGVTVTVGGEAATVTADGRFYHLLTLTEDGVHRVEVMALDRAGNMARATFTVDLRTEAPLMNLVFDPADDRIDPGTLLKVQGAATGVPLTVTIVHETEDNRSEHTFLMVNATFEHYVDLVDGKNTITVRSVDDYGNWNVTAPHVITVKERDVDQTTDSSNLYLLAVFMVAAAIIVVAYLLLRRQP